jgi:hypothetical protein
MLLLVLDLIMSVKDRTSVKSTRDIRKATNVGEG